LTFCKLLIPQKFDYFSANKDSGNRFSAIRRGALFTFDALDGCDQPLTLKSADVEAAALHHVRCQRRRHFVEKLVLGKMILKNKSGVNVMNTILGRFLFFRQNVSNF
jgi:hypothetical protein